MLNDKQIEFVKQNYGKKTYKEISEELNIKQYDIIKVVKNLEIRFKNKENPLHGNNKGKRQIKVDDNFFLTPNNLNCYWAGFIAADGCVRKLKTRKELSIQISQKDLKHLEKFAKHIKFEGKISKYTRKNGISMCSLRVNSEQIFNDLNKNFNITERKTFTLKPPNNLSDEQIDSFIAGYIDGDGCIRKIKSGLKIYNSLDIRGTKNMIDFTKNRFLYLSRNYNFGNKFKGGYIYQEDIKKNHFRYQITGKLCDIIIKKYKEYNIPLLERKWIE